MRTIEAELDINGKILFKESYSIEKKQKILVTLLEESDHTNLFNKNLSLLNSIIFEGDIVSPINHTWDAEK